MLRHLGALCAVVLLTPLARSADTPLVEQYLHRGEFAKGEHALQRHLVVNPRDDQARFGLAFLQIFHGVNRMGQAFYEHGVKSEQTSLPFVRLPVPRNPNPTPITYTAFRRILEAMYRDLEHAEVTLGEIQDNNVKLPLRLAPIRFDFDGDGKATDRFDSLLRVLLRSELQFLQGNSDFLVNFDRGDVAWLRAYCHLLMGILDFTLAFDGEDTFDHLAKVAFTNAKRVKPGDPVLQPNKIAVLEPARFGKFRTHLIAVCKLNRDTWKHIRAETDDDHEWLPNAKQKGVLGLPVRDEQVNAWLSMCDELEALLEGRKVIPQWLMRFLWPALEGGLNLKTVLDDPPTDIELDALQTNGPKAKYMDKKPPDVDVDAFSQVFQLFNNPLGMGYMAWFN